VFVIKIYMDLIKIYISCIFLMCKYSNFKYYIKFRILGARVEKIFGLCLAELVKLLGFLGIRQV